MTWRYWQRNEYADGTSDVVTFLMPVLEVPTEGVFNDYSDGSAVEFTVEWFQPNGSNRFATTMNDPALLTAELNDGIAMGWVLISITQKPATPTEPPIEETEETP